MLLKDIPQLIRTSSYILRKKLPNYPIVASFEVTNRCNLNCKHCYWQKDKPKEELDERLYLRKIKLLKKKHPTIISAFWLGGEPMLRKKIVGTGRNSFSFNTVVTNGTIPLPKWRDVRFVVSMDGTEEFHEKQRKKGIYDIIKKNINRKDLNINLLFIVTQINKSCIEEFVEEWSKTLVRSVAFAFFTPMKGQEDGLWVNLEERDKIIDRILSLKKKYPGFISNPDGILNSFKSDRFEKAYKTCIRKTPKINLNFDSQFKRKLPCILGNKADCSRCGCITSVTPYTIMQGDLSVLKEHFRAKFQIQ